MTPQNTVTAESGQPARAPTMSPAQTLLRHATSFQLSQAIWVAVRLSLADHLKSGPMTAAQLASLTRCHAPSLYRLLRTLAAFNVLEEVEAGVFALAPQGACLCSDATDSIRDLVLLFVGDNFWQTWGALLHSVETGETAFPKLHGVKNSFEYYAQHPDESSKMNHAMTAGAQAIASAVVSSCDFTAARKIADIGGGHGTLIASVLRANPGARGVLFDFGTVVDGASGFIGRSGVADRCELVAGDMFVSLPAGCDTYLLSRVVNSCSDAEAVTVLRNCRAAMTPDAKVILIERVLPDVAKATPEDQSKMMSDLTMLVRTGGRERTADEFRALLSAAGLQVTRIVATQSLFSVIEAVAEHEAACVV